jgi:hypothetical protein
MVVWAVMIPTFVAVTARTLRLLAPGTAVSRFVSDWTLLIVALWHLAVSSAIWFRFGMTRQSRASAVSAALNPPMPWTPGPGGVAAEQR